MENQDREELKHEMNRQGKTKFHQYWKEREGNARWRIWDKLNPHNQAHVDTVTKEVEEELGKRKIGVSEEEDQLRRGKKNTPQRSTPRRESSSWAQRKGQPSAIFLGGIKIGY